MNILSEESCIRIGIFRKPHGISGTLHLDYDPQYEFSLEKAEILLTLTNGMILPWFVLKDGIRIISSQTALVDLEWIDNEKSAKKICGHPVFIEKNKIIDNQTINLFPDWIGFEIYDESGHFTGKVISEENYNGNIVWNVSTIKGEQMIPYHPDLIRSVDPKRGKLVMVIAPGLLEI